MEVRGGDYVHEIRRGGGAAVPRLEVGHDIFNVTVGGIRRVRVPAHAYTGSSITARAVCVRERERE